MLKELIHGRQKAWNTLQHIPPTELCGAVARTWWWVIQGCAVARTAPCTWWCPGFPLDLISDPAAPGLPAALDSPHTRASGPLHLLFLHLRPSRLGSLNLLLKSHPPRKAFPDGSRSPSPCLSPTSDPALLLFMLLVLKNSAYLAVYMLPRCFP